MPIFKKKAQVEDMADYRDIAADVTERDFVPYACHWGPETIVTKNGEVLQIIKISDNASSEGVDLRTEIRNALLESIDTTEYAVWIHTVRRKENFQPEGEFKRDFAGYLDRFWKDRNNWDHKFINEVYITIVREGEGANLTNPLGFMRQIIPRFDIRHRESYLDESTAKLTRVVDKMLRRLSSVGARKLSFSLGEDNVWYSEPVGFFSKLVNLQDDPVQVAQVSLADYITDCDVTFGFNAMEVRMRKDGRRRFGAYLTIKESRDIPSSALEPLLKMPIEFIFSQCFLFLNSKRALKGYEYQKKLFDISNSGTLSVRSGLKSIIDSNTGKPVDFCEHQLGLFLSAESVKTLESSVYKSVVTLGTLGLIPMREDLMLEECFWAMQPANFQYIKRLKPLNTSAMGAFADLTFMPSGKGKYNHWGPAVTTLNTVARTPYFFNFHVEKNGHTVLLGPPDSGKKILMNFLVAQARKFDGKLFYFDRDRLGEIFVRSMDGVYLNLYPGADARPYVNAALNPLQLEDTPHNREFLERWLMLLAGGAAEAALAASCKSVIAEIMQKPKQERQLSVCADMLALQDPKWRTVLSPWLVGGRNAQLFNHPSDTLILEGKVYGFEMEQFIHNREVLLPVLAYLMHRVMQALDGKPAMVVMDEAWDLITTPVIAPRIKSWLNALTEKNAMAFLASENIDAVKNNPINAEILPMCATKIFLPDDAADESYMDAFGLSVKEVALMPEMDVEDRHFLVVKPTESVMLEMDLSGMVDIVSVLAATPFHLQMMEQAITARGISPTQWMPKFLETV